MRTRPFGPVRARIMLCALALPCVLAACGSNGRRAADTAGPATVTRTVTRTATGPTTTATTSTPTTTPTSTSTASQAASDQCVAADLALSFLGGDAATGHDELGFALRNTSSHTCRTGGYPGIQFLDGSGGPLPTNPDHTTSDFFGHSTLQELSVAPGSTVSFRLGVTQSGQGGTNAGCVSAKSVQVIAPNDTATMRVSVHGGVPECGGTVSVSPIQPGTTAFH